MFTEQKWPVTQRAVMPCLYSAVSAGLLHNRVLTRRDESKGLWAESPTSQPGQSLFPYHTLFSVLPFMASTCGLPLFTTTHSLSQPLSSLHTHWPTQSTSGSRQWWTNSQITLHDFTCPLSSTLTSAIFLLLWLFSQTPSLTGFPFPASL